MASTPPEATALCTAPGLDPRPARAGRRLSLPAWVGTLPFLGYVGVFLLLPTVIVLVHAFQNQSGGFSLSGLKVLDMSLFSGGRFG